MLLSDYSALVLPRAGENSGQAEGFRTEPLIDLDTIRAMIEDDSCYWILVGCFTRAHYCRFFSKLAALDR